jgi:hypothetical protein
MDEDIGFKQMIKIIKQGTIDGINILGEYLGEKRK